MDKENRQLIFLFFCISLKHSHTHLYLLYYNVISMSSAGVLGGAQWPYYPGNRISMRQLPVSWRYLPATVLQVNGFTRWNYISLLLASVIILVKSFPTSSVLLRLIVLPWPVVNMHVHTTLRKMACLLNSLTQVFCFPLSLQLESQDSRWQWIYVMVLIISDYWLWIICHENVTIMLIMLIIIIIIIIIYNADI